MTSAVSLGRRTGCVLLLTLLLGSGLWGCASSKAAKKGDEAFRRGNWDAAVAYYQEALDQNPGNKQYEIRLQRAQTEASQVHQAAGKRLWNTGRLEDAALEYELALRPDPTNELAATEYQHVQEDLQIDPESLEPSRMERIKREAAELRLPVTRLEPVLDEPISLSFYQANVTEIYRALAAVGGLNVVFDAGVQDRPTSLVVQDVDFFEALDALTAAQGHFYKAISSGTFIVVPDNPNKRQQFAEEMLRTYYLSNANAEEIGRMLQELLQAQRVSINTALNTVSVRDGPAAIEHADRIVSMVDKSVGEVLLDVEILEANRRVLREYGMSLEPSEVIQSLRQGGGTGDGTDGQGGISLQRLRFLNANDWFFTVPSIRYRLFKESGDFKLVADPQLRLTEGQEATLLVGNEVPIVITTFNPTQLSGNQVVPIRSTDYRDVGITVQAVTRVHHNREVTLELNMEVSSIAGSGIEQLPIFGTREITTVTRLRDGETHVLAGLLRDDERTSLEGFPGLSDIPLLGKLFSSTTREVEQTDVIMTITPHIIRSADIDLADLEAIYMGRQNRADIDAVPAARISPATLDEGVEVVVDSTETPHEAAADVVPADSGPLMIGLVPSEDRVAMGDDLLVGIDIDRARPLETMQLAVQFSSEHLRFVDVVTGSWLERVGGELTEPELTGDGVVRWSVRVDDPSAASEASGRVAVLRFRPLATGIGTLALDAEVQGPDGGPVAARALGAVVEVVR